MEFSTLTLTISAVISTVGLYLYTTGSTFLRTVYLTLKIPGPSLWEIVTVHAKGLLGDNVAEHTWKMCANYGHQPWGMWTHHGYIVMISDCESVSQVYKNKHLTNAPDMIVKILIEFIGKGLMTLNGEEHRLHRKLLVPVFRKSLLEAQLSEINCQAAKLVERLREKSEGPVDVRFLVDDQIAEMVFLTFSSGAVPYEKHQRLYECIYDALLDVHLRSVNPLYYWLVHRMKKSTRQMKGQLNRMLEEGRKNISYDIKIGIAEKLKNYKQAATSPRDVIFQAFQMMDEDSAIDESLHLLSAGQHTTAFTVNITLVLLAIHADVQDKVFQEIRSTIGLVDRPVTPEDLAKMVYLEMILKETLRLFPAAPIMARRADEETRIGDVLIPKGSTVVTHLMAINRDPKFFKDPLKFDPERFSPELSQGRHPFAYVPFGGGNRMCPGQMMAFMVLKTIVCHIVSNFKILPGDGLTNFDDISVSLYFSLELNKSSLRFVPREETNSVCQPNTISY